MSVFVTLQRCLFKLRYVSIVLWGFVESDFFTFAVPNTAFGIFGAFATPVLARSPSISLSSHAAILRSQHAAKAPQPLSAVGGLTRLAVVLLFNLAGLLVFDLANQRTPESVAEDKLNKPWRPIPSGLITMNQARRLMLAAVPATLALNYVLGVWRQGVFILILTWLYNDLRGGDEAFARELIISVAYGLFNNGSLEIAMNGSGNTQRYTSSPEGILWTAIISGVILTTMQVQDLKDMEGDRGRGRKTIAIFLGEPVSRGSIAFFVCFWSWACTRFWHLGAVGSALSWVAAVNVALRVLLVRGRPKEDARTWRMWCVWHATLYLLPIASLYGV